MKHSHIDRMLGGYIQYQRSADRLQLTILYIHMLDVEHNILPPKARNSVLLVSRTSCSG